jgi:hypothetical protein
MVRFPETLVCRCCDHTATQPYHERKKMRSSTMEPEAMDTKLLTEIERQEAALAELPEDYEFPLFDGRQAIESPRSATRPPARTW